MTQKPLSYCLNLLKRRFYSRYELEQALRRRNVDPEEIDEVLRQLQEQGLINDRRFAESWIRSRDSFNPRGDILLRQELVQKGVDKDLIQAILSEREDRSADEEEDQVDQVALAQELVRRKERQYAHLESEIRYRRMLGMLQRRGFTYDVIKQILKR